jgi:hypothetical protein
MSAFKRDMPPADSVARMRRRLLWLAHAKREARNLGPLRGQRKAPTYFQYHERNTALWNATVA